MLLVLPKLAAMVQDAAILAKRLTYSVGAIGLVLLGGYAVMLSQK